MQLSSTWQAEALNLRLKHGMRAWPIARRSPSGQAGPWFLLQKRLAHCAPPAPRTSASTRLRADAPSVKLFMSAALSPPLLPRASCTLAPAGPPAPPLLLERGAPDLCMPEWAGVCASSAHACVRVCARALVCLQWLVSCQLWNARRWDARRWDARRWALLKVLRSSRCGS